MVLLSPLFWLFVGVPLIEVALFAFIGSRIGVLATIVVVILTAAAGASLVRRQGMAVLQRAQNSMNRGVVPTTELVDGVLILAAGLLLLTPGFFTDAVGFFLLIPGGRALIRAWALRRLEGRVVQMGPDYQGFGSPHERRGPRASQIEIVDRSPSNERDGDD